MKIFKLKFEMNMFLFKLAHMALLLFLPLPMIANQNSFYGNTTVLVPYANSKKNEDFESSPKINMGFNGSSHYVQFVMDTGSVGIVASADIFTPAPDAINLGPGKIHYSSSGIIEVG